MLTWSAVLALGRRVVAVLLLRWWGLWNTCTVSYGVLRSDAMACGSVRLGEGLEGEGVR